MFLSLLLPILIVLLNPAAIAALNSELSPASDVHLKASMPPMVRLYGELVPMPGFSTLSALDVRDAITSFLDDKRRKEWELSLELDTAVDAPGIGRFRLNAYFDRLGPAAALRLIPSHIPSFDEIGLDIGLKDKLLPSSGLVLVTGATGVGKSTTLATLLDTVLRERAVHVLTLEAPIEFILEPHRGWTASANLCWAWPTGWARAGWTR